MDKILTRIRDLLIIIGIFLYFTAWVYIHFYYKQFGISTDSLKLDYSSYLVYSYDVLTSLPFLYYAVTLALLLLIAWILIRVSRTYTGSSKFLKAINEKSVTLIAVIKKDSILFIILIMAALFPALFEAARSTALANYRDDRIHNGYAGTIQFVFRAGAESLSPVPGSDSLMKQSKIFAGDIAVIKNDPSKKLALLAESSDYYIIINQPPYQKDVQSWPEANIYYISKKDVLLAKITLRSFH